MIVDSIYPPFHERILPAFVPGLQWNAINDAFFESLGVTGGGIAV
jgi:hypothetical protein